MSAKLLIIVSLIYLCVAWNLLTEQKYGLSLAFLAYAVSNVGLAIATTN